MKIFLTALIILSANVIHAQLQIDSTFQVWGLAFGDYFYKTGGDSTGQQLQYTPYNRNFNAFQFRRIDLGADFSFNKTFDSRIVLEFNGNDYTSNGDRTVIVKDAWIRWKDIFHNASLGLGLLPTPGYVYTAERFWLRSIEKTIMDMRGILGSRDFGLTLNGAFDDAKNFSYIAMVGNGTGLKAENNKYKKFYLTLTGNFLQKKILVQVYSDYTGTGVGTSTYTGQTFVNYVSQNLDIGIETFGQKQTASNTVPFGVSLFSIYRFPSPKFRLFGRYDYYNSNTNSSFGYYQSFVTLGLEYSPFRKVHFMPNLWLNSYANKENQTAGRKTDVVPRITFFFDFR